MSPSLILASSSLLIACIYRRLGQPAQTSLRAMRYLRASRFDHPPLNFFGLLYLNIRTLIPTILANLVHELLKHTIRERNFNLLLNPRP